MLNNSKHIKDNYISTAKALGIILMVIGHSGCPDFLHNLIYAFHMPLFFFCSGFLFTPPETKNIVKENIKKKIKGLYIPYVKWSLIFLVLHNFLYSINIYNSSFSNLDSFHIYRTKEFINKFFSIIINMDGHDDILGGFWFLKTLFWDSIIISLLYLFLKNVKFKYDIILLLLFLFATILFRRYIFINLPFLGEVSIITYGASFFIIGHLFKNFECYNNKILTISLIILFGSTIMLKNKLSVFCEYKIVLIYFIIAICGTYIIFYISKLIEKTNLKYFLYYIGKNTMIILTLHCLFFKIISLIKIFIYKLADVRLAEYPIIKEHNKYFWIAYTIIGISFPLIVQLIYNRYIPHLFKLNKFIKNKL